MTVSALKTRYSTKSGKLQRLRNIFKWKLYKFSNITKENIFSDGKDFEKLSKVCVKYLNEHLFHVNEDRLGLILVLL